jgi:hypothetical protein
VIAFAAVWLSFPFHPIAVWHEGKRIEPGFRAAAAGYEFSVGGRASTLHIQASGTGFRFRLEPPSALAISFRVEGAHRSVRSRSDGRVFQFASGVAYSRLNDSLARVGERRHWKFSADEVEVFGGPDSGGVRLVLSRAGIGRVDEVVAAETDAPPSGDTIPALFLRAVSGTRQPVEVVADGGSDKAAACGAALALWGGSATWKPSADAVDWRTAAQRAGHRPPIERMDTEGSLLPEVYVVHAGSGQGRYASATVFNRFDRARTIVVNPREIGFDDVKEYVYYDVLTMRPLGVALGSIGLTVPASGVRIVLVRQWQGRPAVVGCLESMFGEAAIGARESWDAQTRTLSGEVDSPGDANLIVYNYDRGGRASHVSATNCEVASTENRLRLRVLGSGRRSWSVRFGAPSDERALPAVSVTLSSPSPWSVQQQLKLSGASGCYLSMNDQPKYFTPDSVAIDDETTPMSEYSYRWTPVSHGGAIGTPLLVTARPGWPENSNLGKLPFSDFGPKHIAPRVNRAMDGSYLMQDGRPVFGLSLPADGFVAAKLFGAFLEIQGRARTVGRIRILVNGEVAWTHAGGESEFRLDLTDAREIRIESEGAEAHVLSPLIAAKPHP